MKKSVMQSPGGRFLVVHGTRIEPVNLTFYDTPTDTIYHSNIELHASRSVIYPYNQQFAGGTHTYWWGGYANLKPLCFFNKKLYQACNDASEDDGHLYIGRWDGSGVFYHHGSAYATSKNRCGRGYELITPSGEQNVKSHDLCLLEHNGHLFIVGAVWGYAPPTPNTWNTVAGWGFEGDAFSPAVTKVERCYRAASVTNTDKKMFHTPLRLTTDATHNNHLHATDAISYANDIYLGTWCDIVRFPFGSGTPQLIEGAQKSPSSKAFAIWPASGYDSSGSPVGSKTLFCLTGSGTLKSVSSTGVDEKINLATTFSFDARNKDNFYARINSATDEPGRSTALVNYDKKLHAFVISATSGYRHFYAGEGAPSGASTWTDRSLQLPDIFQQTDGNIYYYTDEHRNKLYVAHVSWSEVGVYGLNAGQHSAGAVAIYRMDENLNWSEISLNHCGLPPRGLIAYHNLGPYCHVPSGSNPSIYPASDYAIVEYTLADHYSRPVDVSIEFSADGGLTWSTARRFKSYSTGASMGSGLTNLATTSEGITYTFYWDYVNDVAWNSRHEAELRVRPKLVRS